MKRFTSLAVLAAVLALASAPAPTAPVAPGRSDAIATAPPVAANIRTVVANDSMPSFQLVAMDSLAIEATPRLVFVAHRARVRNSWSLAEIRLTDAALAERSRPSNRLHDSVGLFRRT